jgi:hypothetical protein
VGAVVLPGLGVGTKRPGVVVADHDDQAGPDDGQQRLELRRQTRPGGQIASGDGSQRTADVADVLGIEDGDLCRVEGGGRVHGRCRRIT